MMSLHADYGLDLFEKLPSNHGYVKSLKSSPVLFTHDDAGAHRGAVLIDRSIYIGCRSCSQCSPLICNGCLTRAGHLKSKDAGLISYAEYLFLLTALVSACRVMLRMHNHRASPGVPVQDCIHDVRH